MAWGFFILMTGSIMTLAWGETPPPSPLLGSVLPHRDQPIELPVQLVTGGGETVNLERPGERTGVKDAKLKLLALENILEAPVDQAAVRAVSRFPSVPTLSKPIEGSLLPKVAVPLEASVPPVPLVSPMLKSSPVPQTSGVQALDASLLQKLGNSPGKESGGISRSDFDKAFAD